MLNTKVSDIINKKFSTLDSILPGVSPSTLKELQERFFRSEFEREYLKRGTVRYRYGFIDF